MSTRIDRDERRASHRGGGVSRRHFLRGVGAAIALPAFQSLRPFGLLAADAPAALNLAATATAAPLRSAFMFFPNGAITSAWWPAGEGQEFELGRTLQPLEPVKDFVQ